jgi:hypothetical protein
VNQPGQPYPGQPYPGQPYPGSVPGPGQYNPAVIQPNPQFPPQGNTAATNPGLAAVQQAILNPAARQSSFANPGQQQQGFGGGIAGVGVPAEIKGSGIMVVKDRSKYREWEFIYDPKEDKNVVGAAAANMNAAGGPGGLSGVTPQTPTKP